VLRPLVQRVAEPPEAHFAHLELLFGYSAGCSVQLATMVQVAGLIGYSHRPSACMYTTTKANDLPSNGIPDFVNEGRQQSVLCPNW
jgi:hypothetical protein